MVAKEFVGFGLLLAIAATILIAVRIHLPFLEPEEGRYAEIPRQMLDGGHLLVPHLDGQPYLDKPPLGFTEMAHGMGVTGVRAGSAAELRAALETALRGSRPCLIDVAVEGKG